MSYSPPVESALETLRTFESEFKRHGVRQVWLFGSRARGATPAMSDWDILVEFVAPPGFDNFMNLKLVLEEKLGARVDLLSRSACKPRFLQAIQEDLRDVA
ncbi:MAG: nucleotidyltransferase family protein [Verrucomicrobia bacterium]|jgi:predicted nucleotidyltransferase|nr:nucleotidyltransferase family protein [Verrucomicrobiota bacterium]